MIRSWLPYAAGFALLLGLGYAYRSHEQKVADTHKTESTVLRGEIIALRKEASAHQALADGFASQASDHETNIASLKAKLAKLQSQPKAPAPQSAPELPNLPADDGNVSADALKDEIIAGQDAEITSLKGEVKELRETISQDVQALDASEKRSRGLEIALDAQTHAAKANKWLGRFEGLAIGISIGYIGRKP